jgi:hypothetical protein
MISRADYRTKIRGLAFNALAGDQIAFNFLLSAVSQGKCFWKTRALPRKTWIKVVDVHKMWPKYNDYNLALPLIAVFWLSLITRDQKLQTAWGYELAYRFEQNVDRIHKRNEEST